MRSSNLEIVHSVNDSVYKKSEPFVIEIEYIFISLFSCSLKTLIASEPPTRKTTRSYTHRKLRITCNRMKEDNCNEIYLGFSTNKDFKPLQ